MSNTSNKQGRAYEYACMMSLYRELKHFRPVDIEQNSSFMTNKVAYESLDSTMQAVFDISAEAATRTILDFEPLLSERCNDVLTLSLQKDTEGEKGDVRDLLAIRQEHNWEIGLSIKHGHKAVKHSRLSRKIDFGEKWYGIPCTKDYWDAVAPIFDRLDKEHKSKTKWRDITDTADTIYGPVLEAFVTEVAMAYNKDQKIAKKIAEYLLGKFDFYKVIGIDKDKVTLVQAFNFKGTLNKPSKSTYPRIDAPISCLPTRIIKIETRPNCRKKNYVDLYMDNGWTFSLRIHSASTIVQSSLKFDVQLVGRPATVVEITSNWL